MHKNRIEYSVYAVKRIISIHKMRSHHCDHAVIRHTAGSKQLDRFLHRFCIGDLCRRNFCDALCINIRKINAFSISKGRKDRDLAAGIMPLHIRFRIPLRIALLLCIL